MRRITLNLSIAVLAFSTGIAVNRLIDRSPIVESALTYLIKATGVFKEKKPEARLRNIPFDLPLSSEITFKRIYDGCENCGNRKIVFHKERSGEFEDATVTEIDLHTGRTRYGKLESYYYANLMRLIESQGYFEMADEYAMGWVDSVIVTCSVEIGGRRKQIVTTNEADVPAALWGLYYAIDGVTAHVKWEGNR